MFDGCLGHQTSSSGQIVPPGPQDAKVSSGRRHVARAGVLEHFGFLVQAQNATTFDVGRVPQLSLVQNPVEQFGGRRFDLGRHFPQSQLMPVADFLPGNVHS